MLGWRSKIFDLFAIHNLELRLNLIIINTNKAVQNYTDTFIFIL